jgi:DNA-binding NtrC family response regulator
VEPPASAQSSPLASGAQVPAHASRRRVLVVEPDALTQWSLRTYLAKWFLVRTANSVACAQQVLLTHPVDVLVVSDELPPDGLAALEQQAHSFNARVAVVWTVTDSSRSRRPAPQVGCLEKPFELAQLARLLGVPEDELPRE